MKEVKDFEIDPDDFARWQIEREIKKGFDAIGRGEYSPAEEVFKRLDKKYGIVRS
jgi:predicted transcriptional regulator